MKAVTLENVTHSVWIGDKFTQCISIDMDTHSIIWKGADGPAECVCIVPGVPALPAQQGDGEERGKQPAAAHRAPHPHPLQ